MDLRTPPAVDIVHGEPREDELAALLAVLATRRPAPRGAPRTTRTSAWSDPAAALRRPLPTAPGGWRASALPGR